MNQNGWIKLHREELERYSGLTDREFRYLIVSRLSAVWDRRNKLAGTFDARTHVVKQDLLPYWAMGKINSVKNSLLSKAFYEKTDDPRRLKILYPTRPARHIESKPQTREENIQGRELSFQEREQKMAAIREMLSKISTDKRIS